MDDASIILGLIAGGVSGWALARSMKINGRPWWWRHLASWSLAPFFAMGVATVLAGLTGVRTDDGEPLGVAGVVGGAVVGLPMAIALWVSWRAARRRPVASAQPEPAPEPTPESVPESTPEPVPQPTPERVPNPTPEPDPVGRWREIDGQDVEFEYVDEKGERSSVNMLVFSVCDSHFAGLSLAPDDGPDDLVFAFSGVAGRVYFVLDDEEADADGLRQRLLAAPDAPSRERRNDGVDTVGTDSLSFAYTDAQGNHSIRDIIDWHVDGNYVTGFCIEQEAVRTFRRDRIDYFLHGEDKIDGATPAPPVAERPTPSPTPARKGAPEILFTGFDAASRKTLEATAESHGFRVRKSVTKNLDVLVKGPRPSQSKLADAEDKPGCSVVDKEGFLWMVATGEITS